MAFVKLLLSQAQLAPTDTGSDGVFTMLVRYRFHEFHNRSIDPSFVAEPEQLVNSHQTIDR